MFQTTVDTNSTVRPIILYGLANSDSRVSLIFYQHVLQVCLIDILVYNLRDNRGVMMLRLQCSIAISARAPVAAGTNIVAISVAATHNPLLEYMHEALEREHKGVPMLALAPEPEDLNKEPEPTATLPAPGGRRSWPWPLPWPWP